MQTFLPNINFVQSARILDYRRLGKQRLQAKQILQILNGKVSKYFHHPAVLMWTGYEETLAWYHDIVICEWVQRGYNNTMETLRITPEEYSDPEFRLIQVNSKKEYERYMHWAAFHDCIINPHWLTDEFCSYHRATLLYKNPQHYSQFNWTEVPKYEYLWPTKVGK